VLTADPEVSARVPAAALEDLFDPTEQLAHVDDVFRRLGLLDVSPEAAAVDEPLAVGVS
jgi:hypothetical protein